MSSLDLAPRTLILDLRGFRNTCVIAPLEFQHPVLAAELADALILTRSTFDLADGTLLHYFRAIVSLLRTLPDELPRTASLSNEGSRVIDAFHSWEVAMGERHSATSSVPSTHGRFVRRTIKSHAGNGGSTGAATHAWASGPNLHQQGVNTPLDEFSNAERIAIRDACRNRIRALERRLAVGRQLLAEGQDPRKHGWVSPANVLWGIRHLGRPGDDPIASSVAGAAATGVFDALDTSVRDMPTGARGVPIAHAMTFAMSYIYPTALDLVAFRSLLQLETAAAPEELTGVQLDDIEWTSEFARIKLNKARSRRTRSIRCKVSAPDPGAGWRAGDLVHRLLNATSAARDEPQSTESADPLFLTVRRDRRGALIAGAEPFGRNWFSQFLRAIDTPISHPHDPRRLRKTVKSVRAAVLRSVEVAAGDDHTVAVFQRHYAQSTTVHILAGAAVTTAQNQVFDRLRRGPTFVHATAAELIDNSDPRMASAAAAEASSSEVDREVNVVQCTDPYDSPFGTVGRLCAHRPSMCFACPNAIVFTDHVPRLLEYRAILRAQQKELSPTQFAAIHGQQLANLERILQEFPDAALRPGSGTQPVHVPLAERGVHL
jgi:hypothetical protein